MFSVDSRHATYQFTDIDQCLPIGWKVLYYCRQRKPRFSDSLRVFPLLPLGKRPLLCRPITAPDPGGRVEVLSKGVVVVTPEVALTSRIEELSDGAATLVLSGEIDLATAPGMVSRFQELADRGLTDVIVDARGVSFIDATGLHGLIEGKRIIHKKGSQIVLVPSRQMRRLLEMVFPEPIFTDRVDSLDEAYAMLGVERNQQT